MNITVKLACLTLLLSALPFTIIAQDKTDSYVQISINYTSMFQGHIQVRDEICKGPRSIDCEKASIRVNSEKCRKVPTLTECQEAKSLLDSKFCMEGLIYDGMMSYGQKLNVRLCKSSTGYANLSVRNTTDGDAWTNYSLITGGEQISYP